MDAVQARSTLRPVVQALQRQVDFDLIAVVLFGSRARGDERPESDWDLFVIASPLPTKPFPRHLLLKAALPADWRGNSALLAKTPAEFEADLSTLYLDIALDGLILYDTDGYMKRHLTGLRQLIREQGLYREQRGRDLIWSWETLPGPGWQLTWEGTA